MRKYLALFFAFMLYSGASAQTQSDLGVYFKLGDSPSLGLVYNVQDVFALRPSISFSQSTTQRELSTTSFSLLGGLQTTTQKADAKETRFGGSLAGLFYFPSQRGLLPYFGIEAGYTSLQATTPVVITTSDSTELPIPIPISIPRQEVVTRNASASLISINGIFGVQYAVSRQFHVFGEMGFGYTTGDVIGNISGEKTKYESIGLFNSGLGIIFYF